MKKLLILGAGGLLGSALTKRFINHYDVSAWDKPNLDITDRVEVNNRITELKPDYIINATAFNGVDQAEKDERMFRVAKKINSDAVGLLAEVAKKINAPFFHFSSDYVFSGDSNGGYKEDAELSPINKYGLTKAWGESNLRSNTDKFYLIRLSRMFGSPGKSPDAKKSFVDQIISFAENKTELELVDEEFSCPTYSNDLADLVFQLVEKNMPYGIYHGANSGVCSWFQMAQEIFKIKKIDIKLVPISGEKFARAAKRPSYSELINTKLPLQRNWQEALREYLD